MAAELLGDHDWPWYAHILCRLVHAYDHVDTYCPFPRPDPDKPLLVTLSDEQVKLVGKPGFLSLPKRVAFNFVALLAEVCDNSVHQRSGAHLINNLKQNSFVPYTEKTFVENVKESPCTAY